MKLFSRLALLAAVSGALLAAPAARAQFGDDLVPLAPPVGFGRYDDSFLWRGVPIGERIPIERACFDQGGYRLIDELGQSIIVPFENRNLYVMRFGRAPGSQMYFVNDGNVPTLYIPENGYLENLVAMGARWYPFPRRYYYVRPIFVGLAPSWSDYCAMGWYPGMVCYGGWGGYQPWGPSVIYTCLNGFGITIGNLSWNNWGDYCNYYRVTPARRVIIVDYPGYYRPQAILRQGYPRYDNRRDDFDRFGNFDRFGSFDRFGNSGRSGTPARERELDRQGGSWRSFDSRSDRSDFRGGSFQRSSSSSFQRSSSFDSSFQRGAGSSQDRRGSSSSSRDFRSSGSSSRDREMRKQRG